MHKRIFLLDDDQDEHEIFQSALRRVSEELSFTSASSWQEAQQKLGESTPDYIFLDLNMPKTNGFQCLAEIRKRSDTRDTPVYLYSTGITEKEGKKAISDGANDVIVKPASFIDLCKLLRKIIR